MGIINGYIGTYFSPESMGIYRFPFDTATGIPGTPELFYEAADAKYVALRTEWLVAPFSRGGKSGLCLLNISSTGSCSSAELLSETSSSCFTAFHEGFIYTANYHEGSVLVYLKTDCSVSLIKRINVAPEAGCHQVLFHNNFILVPCLEQDKVRLFDRTRDYAAAGEIAFPEGAGPRHGVFDRKGERLYIAGERNNRLYTFRAEKNGNFTAECDQSVLPEGLPEGSTAAAVRLSPDGRFLYVSVRTANVLAVFRLENGLPEPVQQHTCGGDHPRDFIVSPDGRFILAVNRTSGNLVSFMRDTESGKIGELCADVPVHQGVSLVLEGGE